MSSSLTNPRPVEPAAEFTAPSLLDLLSQVTDHRARRRRRHRLSALLAVALAAILAGAKSFLAVAEWINDPTNTTIDELGVDLHRRPSEATVRRALSHVNADLLDRVLGTWMWTRTATINNRRIIAVDGKTVRGARTPSDPNSRAPHLVAAYDHSAGTVLGQLQIDAKTNEIPTLRDLLDQFDLTDCVVTADAMHCQDGTADETGFPHAAQLVQVRRTRTVYPATGAGSKQKKFVEVVYSARVPWGTWMRQPRRWPAGCSRTGASRTCCTGSAT